MNVILVEAQYVGALSYWKQLLLADKIIMDQHEHYVRRSYRNRCHILGANGLLRLSIPLERGKNQHDAMKDVRISYNEDWQKLHWQSVTSAYRRSPYFEFYEDHFIKFYENKFSFLLDYNIEILHKIASILKVSLSIELTEKYVNTADFEGLDLRSQILPAKKSMLTFAEYPQVFSDRFPFEKDLSMLDLLFNKGTMSLDYLQKLVV
ncbi:MAG: WbqC family protein [Chitinophagales bacterium]